MKNLRKCAETAARRKLFVVKQTNWDIARDIMGEDFLGTKEVAQVFGSFWLEESQRSILHSVPFSEDTLKKCKADGFKLFLGINQNRNGDVLTIKCFRGMFPELFGEKDNFSFYGFAKRTVIEPEWYLVKGSIVEESRKKLYQDQEKILNENEYRENAVLYVYLMCLMYKVRGERLFDEDFVWCADKNGEEGRVFAGFSQAVININWIKERRGYSKLCLVPARKPDF